MAHCTGCNLLRLSAAKTMHCMQYATDIELHVHSYAVGVADIAAREGSPHNVLHSSSINRHVQIADKQHLTSFTKTFLLGILLCDYVNISCAWNSLVYLI